MDEDLDALVRRVDPDRWLSSRFIADPAIRADVVAIYAYDHELARAPKVASNPLLGEIRLAWWREALDEIYENRPVRRHPVAQALAAAVTRRGLPRAPLETMIDARYRELDAAPMDAADALAWARDTAGEAAEIAAGLLGGASGHARAAGAAWALRRRDLQADVAQARADARRLPASAFPAVAHAGLKPRQGLRGLRVMLAVATGRL